MSLVFIGLFQIEFSASASVLWKVFTALSFFSFQLQSAIMIFKTS